MRIALSRQGELAAGWNAAAQAVKAKGIPAKVKRHGNIHGAFKKYVYAEAAFNDISFEYTKHGVRSDFEYFIRRAIQITEAALKNALGKKFTQTLKKNR